MSSMGGFVKIGGTHQPACKHFGSVKRLHPADAPKRMEVVKPFSLLKWEEGHV